MKIPADWGSRIVVIVTVLIVAGYLLSRGNSSGSSVSVTSVPVKEPKPAKRTLSAPVVSMVNLNSASAKELTEVGLTKPQADALIQKRPFSKVEEAARALGLTGDEAERLAQRVYVAKAE